jgi:hypothetical protein
MDGFEASSLEQAFSRTPANADMTSLPSFAALRFSRFMPRESTVSGGLVHRAD